MRSRKYILLILTIAQTVLTVIPARGQFAAPARTEQLAVTARPSADSITLRWAPLNFKAWRAANLHGYRIERYVMARNGVLLSKPEKTILAPLVMPQPERNWIDLVQRDKYAAIAAQALYGDRFEIDLRQSDVFSIADKAKENEQRFAFALFAADMSPHVAIASGLWLTDRTIASGEKYLYRIVVNTMDSIRGTIYLSADDRYTLPSPQNLEGEFREQLVSLKWDKSPARFYTAYIVERSTDGKQFSPVSDTPLVTVAPEEMRDVPYEYAIDSLNDLSRMYYYRVVGITPFGEYGPPSAVISGKGTPSVSQVPFIAAIENRNNQTLHIRWNFPESDNEAIEGFIIERADKPDGVFSTIHPNTILPSMRSYEDTRPGQVNYYRVSARGLDQELYPSHLYFAQLIDSIPPEAPSGLAATISDSGIVNLSWKANTEHDIYGYRVYKSFHKSEELAQITSAPHQAASFIDKVDLNTLNETVYYSVMAIDVNQNHSALSSLLKVPLPDNVRPQPAVFLPPANTREGVALRWMPSPSEDVIRYTVYRRAAGQTQWEEISIVETSADSVYEFLDKTALPGQTSVYTLVATDEAGLESQPAAPVTGRNANGRLRPAITWKRPLVGDEEHSITLRWTYDHSQPLAFRIYRSVNELPPLLFRTVSGDARTFIDAMVPGTVYTYRIMAVFPDGQQSSLSEPMKYQY